MSEIYLPREDTYLMEQALSRFNLKNKKILEMGCGSGYLSIYCAKQNAIVTAIDINIDAIKYASEQAKKEKLKINFIESDLFFALNKEQKFDIIFFNPPYLVSDEIKELALDGGKDGREIIDKFLKDFDKYLLPEGFVLLLHTDYNNLVDTKELLEEKGFDFDILEKEHLFFEDLYILKIKKIDAIK